MISFTMTSSSGKTIVSSPTLYYTTDYGGLIFALAEDAKYVARIHTAICDATTWAELRHLMPRKEYSKILKDYDEQDEPRPKGSDLFSAEQIPAYCDGDYPQWLQQDMDLVLPDDILDRYGKVENTRFNGAYIYIDPSHEDAIVADLKAEGYRVVKRNDLPFN